jgi:hypothetical protein
VRITEARENYARQHTVDDTPDGVDTTYLLRNVRVNIATLASLALAPQAPGVTDDEGTPRLTRGSSGYDAHLAWTPCEGAIGYRVFWRHAWAPDWEDELTLGPVTELTLSNMSIDDMVIGVAAVGRSGNESLTSVYLMPERKLKEIRTLQ